MATATAKRTLASTANIGEALALLTAGEWTPEDFTAWDESRKTERAPGKLYCKTSRKGALSVYGLNTQFPVSLYAEQWERLFSFREQIEAHIAADKPQRIEAEKDKDGKVGKVAVTVRLKRKGMGENDHIVESDGTMGKS